MGKTKLFERSPEVGIFFVVNGKVYGWGDPVREMKPVQGFYDSPLNHLEYWDELTHSLPELFKYRLYDYSYFPRGRVLYTEKEECFIVYADKCILKDDHLKSLIIEEFALPANNVSFREDEHYQCHDCNSDILEYQKFNEKFCK